MKQAWHPDELVQHWTLSADEQDLVSNNTGVTRWSCAVLLKYFQLEGRFPENWKNVPSCIVDYLARQVGASLEAYFTADWSDRTQRHQRAQIRGHCGFRVFHARDEVAFTAW